MNEPLSWRPKLLKFEETRYLFDYESIESDLQFSRSCFQAICNHPFGIVYSPRTLAADVKGRNAWCCFVGGSISYRRCFKSGVRAPLTKGSIVPHLSNEQIELHDTLVDIVDKHVAHSVNEMELGCTSLQVARDSHGKIHRGGVGSQSLVAGPFSAKGYNDICVLISLVLDAVVAPLITSQKEIVGQIIDTLTDDQIDQLPDAFPPHIDRFRFGVRRNWPPKEGA